MYILMEKVIFKATYFRCRYEKSMSSFSSPPTKNQEKWVQKWFVILRDWRNKNSCVSNCIKNIVLSMVELSHCINSILVIISNIIVINNNTYNNHNNKFLIIWIFRWLEFYLVTWRRTFASRWLYHFAPQM